MLRKNNKEKKDIEKKELIKKKEVIKKSKPSVKISSDFTMIEVIVIIIITALVVSVCSGLIVFNNYDKLASMTEKENGTDLSEFIESYNHILNSYVEKVDEKGLIDSAIKGMYSYLGDAYTGYIDKDSNETLSEQLDGTYQGIGVEISTNEDNEVEILRIFKDSPAEKAGLKAGDVILAINGQSMIGKTPSDVSETIKKGEKTNYTIKYKRKNKEYEVSIDREEVYINSVETKEYGEVGYMHLETFSATTEEQVKKALDSFGKSIKYLVIDVRNNSGGYLSAAYGVSDLFLPKGKIVYQLKDRNNKITKYEAKNNEHRKFDKIVMLVNGGSASASEILTAALKDNGVASVVGTLTFGKGTVQETEQLSSGAMVKYTTSYWLTPNGDCINEEGIAPDIMAVDDEKTKDDEQLDAALKEAKK